MMENEVSVQLVKIC